MPLQVYIEKIVRAYTHPWPVHVTSSRFAAIIIQNLNMPVKSYIAKILN